MLYYLCITTSGASALALLVSGVRMLSWTRRLELSTRSGLAWSMIGAAALTIWSLGLEPADPVVSMSAVILALISGWLVWWPHRHPSLERVTTGFGYLDGPGVGPAAESRLQ